MLAVHNPHTRRAFLTVGGLGLAAPGLFANPGSAAAKPTTGKSVIFLFMQGGPPQHETFDPKPDLPAEMRTVGGVVPTSIPGVHFGDALPNLAKHAHRLAVVRNFVTGTQHGGLKPVVSEATKGASLGAVYNGVAGAVRPDTGLPNAVVLWPKSVDPSAAGPRARFGQFDVTGPLNASLAPLTPGAGGQLEDGLKLRLDPDRLGDRRGLLAELDRAKFGLDAAGALDALDGQRRQAFEMVLKGVGAAFDVSKEDPKLVARYDTGRWNQPKLWGTKKNAPYYESHTKTVGKLLLLARRLCEAGCGQVTVNTEFNWDFHADGNNLDVAAGKKVVVEPFDHAVGAFIEDVEARGLSDKILLVCCGEMGRTPKINKNGGRDHWPNLAPLMLYGGGLTRGQVVGASDRDGAKPVGPPTRPENLLATVLNTLFDPGQLRLMPNLSRDLLGMVTATEKVPGVV
jgi:hypothetical protein